MLESWLRIFTQWVITLKILDSEINCNVQVYNNIAEGADSGSDNLFVRYLQIAKGSSGEVKSMLYVCEDIGYLPAEQTLELRNRVYNISSSIQKLIDYLKKQSNPTK